MTRTRELFTERPEKLHPVWILNKYGDIQLEMLTDAEYEAFEGSETPGNKYRGIMHWWDVGDAPQCLRDMLPENSPSVFQLMTNRLVQHDSRNEFERGLLENAKKAGQMIVSAADEVLDWNTNALPWEVIGRVSSDFNKAMKSLNEICEAIRNGEQGTVEE